MNAFNCMDTASNQWGGDQPLNEYYCQYMYDGNGNITDLYRNGNIMGQENMDNLDYHYYAETNRLEYVTDTVPEFLYANDVGNQNTGNYQYDETGNLVKDKAEEIDTILWTLNGKINRIARDEASEKADLEFAYWPDGNRLQKTVFDTTWNRSSIIVSLEGDTVFYDSMHFNINREYYKRDAAGNVMALYERRLDLKREYGYTRNVYDTFLMVLWDDLGEDTFKTYLLDPLINDTIIRENIIFAINNNQWQAARDTIKMRIGYRKFGDEVTELLRTCNLNSVLLNRTEYWEQIWLKEQYIYGSSRLGIYRADSLIDSIKVSVVYNPFTRMFVDEYKTANWSQSIPDTLSEHYYVRTKGKRHYELTNHLGNVLVTITDRKIPVAGQAIDTVLHYTADVLSATDYYPFGSLMPGRNVEGDGYRFGFNSQEKDDEIYGTGNSYTAEFWQYDTRLGRRWNVDPVDKPWMSSYHSLSNRPITSIDPNGALDGYYVDEKGSVIGKDKKNDDKVYFVTGNDAEIVKKDNFNIGIDKNSLADPIELPSLKQREILIEKLVKIGSNDNTREYGMQINRSEDDWIWYLFKGDKSNPDNDGQKGYVTFTSKNIIEKGGTFGMQEFIRAHVHNLLIDKSNGPQVPTIGGDKVSKGVTGIVFETNFNLTYIYSSKTKFRSKNTMNTTVFSNPFLYDGKKL